MAHTIQDGNSIESHAQPIQRFVRALGALLGAEPPREYVDMWLADEQIDGEDPLRAWVSDRGHLVEEGKTGGLQFHINQ